MTVLLTLARGGRGKEEEEEEEEENKNKYRICSRNLRTFFSNLAAEKSGCVKYAVFLWKS